jgi:hypothetical protein
MRAAKLTSMSASVCASVPVRDGTICLPISRLLARCNSFPRLFTISGRLSSQPVKPVEHSLSPRKNRIIRSQ